MDKPDSGDQGGAEANQPVPSGKPSRLDWWLGRTPEQVEAIERDVAARQNAPLWIRVCVVVGGLALIALIVSVVGWLALVPTVGFITICSVHRLLTGAWIKPPLPVWMHLAFIGLLIISVLCMAALR